MTKKKKRATQQGWGAVKTKPKSGLKVSFSNIEYIGKIPKIMHCVRVGPNTPPMKWINTRKEKHPTRQYKLRGNEELKNVKRENQKAIDYYAERGKRNGVTDIMRYEILYNHGGAMHGADRECVNSIDDIFESGDIAYQIDTSNYGNKEPDPRKEGCAMPLFASIKGFEGAKTLINLIGQIKDFLEPAVSTGNWLMAKLNNKYNYNIKTLPIHQFIPEHFNGRKYEGEDKIYSKHYWGTTKNTYEKGMDYIELNKNKFKTGKGKDIVYVMKKGPLNDIELKYSIRSLKNLPHRNLIIIGHKPSWLNDKAIHIPFEDSNDKTPYENVIGKYKVICEYDQISDDFVVMNDDIYILKPINELTIYSKGTLEKHLDLIDRMSGHSKYHQVVEKVYELFPEGISYNTHTPFVYNKTKLLELINKHDDINIRSLYGNHYSIPHKSFLEEFGVLDCKLYSNRIQDAHDIENQHYISTDDDLNYMFQQYLNKQFGSKSEYEL